MAPSGSSHTRAKLFVRRGDGAMPTYQLRLPAQELVRLVRAEVSATAGAPELFIEAYRDYVIEEDYNRAAYGLHDGSEYDLVISEAVLAIEPRVEQNYWVLTVTVRKVVGPQIVADETALIGASMSLEAFEAALGAPDAGTITVRLDTQSPTAKQHFVQWWTALQVRHAQPAGAAG